MCVWPMHLIPYQAFSRFSSSWCLQAQFCGFFCLYGNGNPGVLETGCQNGAWLMLNRITLVKVFHAIHVLRICIPCGCIIITNY